MTFEKNKCTYISIHGISNGGRFPARGDRNEGVGNRSFRHFWYFFENCHFLQPSLEHIQYPSSTVVVLKYLRFGISRRQYPHLGSGKVSHGDYRDVVHTYHFIAQKIVLPLLKLYMIFRNGNIFPRLKKASLYMTTPQTIVFYEITKKIL